MFVIPKRMRNIAVLFIVVVLVSYFLYFRSKSLELPDEVIISSFYPVNVFYFCCSLCDETSYYHSSSSSQIPALYSGSNQIFRSLYFCFMEINDPWRNSEIFVFYKPVESSFIEYFMYSTRSLTLCHENTKECHEISWEAWEYISLDIYSCQVMTSIDSESIVSKIFCFNSSFMQFVEKGSEISDSCSVNIYVFFTGKCCDNSECSRLEIIRNHFLLKICFEITSPMNYNRMIIANVYHDSCWSEEIYEIEDMRLKGSELYRRSTRSCCSSHDEICSCCYGKICCNRNIIRWSCSWETERVIFFLKTIAHIFVAINMFVNWSFPDFVSMRKGKICFLKSWEESCHKVYSSSRSGNSWSIYIFEWYIWRVDTENVSWEVRSSSETFIKMYKVMYIENIRDVFESYFPWNEKSSWNERKGCILTSSNSDRTREI